MLKLIALLLTPLVLSDPGDVGAPTQSQASGVTAMQRPARATAAEASAASGAQEADDAYLQWPLPPTGRAYGAINGRHLHALVVEQAAISRRYRDQGHPTFWGRIIGTSSDAESAEWLAQKFTALGLSDVRVQSLDLQPQWMPQTWDVSVTGGDKTIRLESA